MTRVISISLWGNDPMFTQGAIENVRLARIFYPTWQVWIYHDNTVPGGVLTDLQHEGAVLKPQMPEKGYVRLFWRFLPAAISHVDRFVSRDADARIGLRESLAVKEWEGSGLKFHVMRDHPNHNHPIMGGMYGAVSGAIPNALRTIKNGMRGATASRRVTHQGDGFGEDQIWLREVIWPMAQGSCMQHDDMMRFGECLGFPANRIDSADFIGNKYTADGKPVYTTESR